ncbi:MAG: hypothetical protein K0R94_1434 [Burkholderiales bacterium]|nr:hypothetical protein [Burkholderiales bacterium]
MSVVVSDYVIGLIYKKHAIMLNHVSEGVIILVVCNLFIKYYSNIIILKLY